MTSWSKRSTWFALAAASNLAAVGCVTDPTSEKASSFVKAERELDRSCRELIRAKAKGKHATYYFAKLPRETARTYAAILGTGGGTAILCDNEAKKIVDTKAMSAAQTIAFSRDYSRRRQEHLTGHQGELSLTETSTAAVVELDTAGKATEFWLPKHLQKEFNDLFYDLFK